MKIKLTDWDGEQKVVEIKKEWLDDILDAVAGQYYLANKVKGYEFDGTNYSEVVVVDWE